MSVSASTASGNLRHPEIADYAPEEPPPVIMSCVHSPVYAVKLLLGQLLNDCNLFTEPQLENLRLVVAIATGMRQDAESSGSILRALLAESVASTVVGFTLVTEDNRPVRFMSRGRTSEEALLRERRRLEAIEAVRLALQFSKNGWSDQAAHFLKSIATCVARSRMRNPLSKDPAEWTEVWRRITEPIWHQLNDIIASRTTSSVS
jgi:hypothetical protein